MIPEQALTDMDNVVRQVSMTREQHAHMVNCRNIVGGALTILAELTKDKESQNGDQSKA